MQVTTQKRRWVIFLVWLVLFITACGTFEVGLEPEASAGEVAGATAAITESTATPTLESTPALLTSIPTVSTESVATTTAEPTLVPTPVPEPTSERSSLWTEYRDPYAGYGIALPCYWVILPSVPDRPSSPIISSYDEWFFLNRSVRGSWKDAVVPEGAYAFDFNVHEDVDPALSLRAAVEAIIASQATQGADVPVLEVTAIEEVTVGRNPAVLVTMDVPGDTPYDLIQPNQYYAFRLSPERILVIYPKTRQALESPEVQSILASLALTPEDEVIIPNQPPGGPLAGREIYLNEERGFCFSYPSEFTLETYQAGALSYIGEVVNLKLERPFYTVGMTIKSWRVGEQAELSQVVDNYLLQFADTTSIERNGPEWYAMQLGGREVEVLDGVPGDVETLEVFTLEGDLIYQLTTLPSITGSAEASVDANLLFGVVTTSFTFLQ